MLDFSVYKCDITDIITETIRFLSHLLLIHVFTYIVDTKEEFMNKMFVRTMLFTAMSIIIYNLVVKKLFMENVVKLRAICDKERAAHNYKIM